MKNFTRNISALFTRFAADRGVHCLAGKYRVIDTDTLHLIIQFFAAFVFLFSPGVTKAQHSPRVVSEITATYADGNDQFGDPSILMQSDSVTVIGASFRKAVENRWMLVELSTFSKASNEADRPLIISREMYSVDCRDRGIEKISTYYNLETNSKSRPRWAGVMNPDYQDGFRFEEIKHKTPRDLLESEIKQLSRDLGEEKKDELRSLYMNPVEPENSNLAIDFACNQIQGMTAEQSARNVLVSGGLDSIQALLCTLQPKPHLPVGKVEWLVIFHEPKSLVYVNGLWKTKRSVSLDRITADINEKSTLTISRLTGSAKIEANGRILFEGSCHVHSERRKF